MRRAWLLIVLLILGMATMVWGHTRGGELFFAVQFPRLVAWYTRLRRFPRGLRWLAEKSSDFMFRRRLTPPLFRYLGIW